MLKGKRRHSIYMAVDIWSRRTMVLVTETPRAAAVALLIRKCIMAWGVPKRIKTDNGSDFVAHATQRLFTSLGIEVERSMAFDPKSKGNVERVIGTFQRDLAICPGFIGHSVADRKIIENRKAFNQRLGTSDEDFFDVQMDVAEFKAWCDDWAENIYGTAVHSALKGKSPMLKAASWPGPVRRIDDSDALDILLAPIAGGGGIRRVATYEGGTKLDADYGRTVVDNDGIKTGAIDASKLVKTAALITERAQAGVGVFGAINIGSNELYIPRFYTRSDISVDAESSASNPIILFDKTIPDFNGGGYIIAFTAMQDASSQSDSVSQYLLYIDGALVAQTGAGVRVSGADAKAISAVTLMGSASGTGATRIIVKCHNRWINDINGTSNGCVVRNATLTVSGTRR